MVVSIMKVYITYVADYAKNWQNYEKFQTFRIIPDLSSIGNYDTGRQDENPKLIAFCSRRKGHIYCLCFIAYNV